MMFLGEMSVQVNEALWDHPGRLHTGWSQEAGFGVGFFLMKALFFYSFPKQRLKHDEASSVLISNQSVWSKVSTGRSLVTGLLLRLCS